MKTLIQILLFTLIIVPVSTPVLGGDAIINAYWGHEISVYLDGQLVNTRPAEKVILEVRSGTHNIMINMLDKKGNQTVVHHDRLEFDPWLSNEYQLVMNRYGNSQLIHTGQNFVSDYGKNYRRSHRNGHVRRDRFYDTRILSEYELLNLKRDLRYSLYDETKLHLIEQTIDGRLMFAEDLRQLMLLLDFDHNRVALGKLAFGQVIDKQNFYITYKVVHHRSRKVLAAYARACGW